MKHESCKVLTNCNIMEEKTFNLSPNEYHEIHQVLKKYKLTYLNRKIHLFSQDMVVEFHVNGYRPPFEKTKIEPTLLSWVRGKEIRYN